MNREKIQEVVCAARAHPVPYWLWLLVYGSAYLFMVLVGLSVIGLMIAMLIFGG